MAGARHYFNFGAKISNYSQNFDFFRKILKIHFFRKVLLSVRFAWNRSMMDLLSSFFSFQGQNTSRTHLKASKRRICLPRRINIWRSKNLIFKCARAYYSHSIGNFIFYISVNYNIFIGPIDFPVELPFPKKRLGNWRDYLIWVELNAGTLY